MAAAQHACDVVWRLGVMATCCDLAAVAAVAVGWAGAQNALLVACCTAVVMTAVDASRAYRALQVRWYNLLVDVVAPPCAADAAGGPSAQALTNFWRGAWRVCVQHGAPHSAPWWQAVCDTLEMPHGMAAQEVILSVAARLPQPTWRQ